MNLDVLDEDNIKHRRLLAAVEPVSDQATNLI